MPSIQAIPYLIYLYLSLPLYLCIIGVGGGIGPRAICMTYVSGSWVVYNYNWYPTEGHTRCKTKKGKLA